MIDHQPPATSHQLPLTNSHTWIKDFYLWLPLACVSWWLAWKYQDRFISDWDGFDYTAYTVEGVPSALGLGRAFFLGYNHLLWRAVHRWLGWPPEQAYLVLRYGAIAQAGVAVTGIYALCRELTASKLAAFFGALIVVASPFFITYSGRSMSEIPAFAMLSWSLWWMLRSLRLEQMGSFFIAAFLIGFSANIREFAIFYFPFIPLAARFYEVKWRYGAVALALAVLAAGVGMMFWAWRDGNVYWAAVGNWYHLSAQERKVHPVTIKNFQFLAEFAFNCSSAVAMLTPLALVWVSSKRQLKPLLLFGLCGLAADLVLLANHDLPVNPRYLLTGLLGLAAVCGWCLAELLRLRPLRGAMILAGLIALTQATYNHEAKELYSAEWNAKRSLRYISKIETLPWNSGFIVGMHSPLIHFLQGVGAHPYWRGIAPGAPWPDERLDDAIQEFFDAGRIVYVDFDSELWQSGAREHNREAAGLEKIKREYKLELIQDSFYRIVERNSALPVSSFSSATNP